MILSIILSAIKPRIHFIAQLTIFTIMSDIQYPIFEPDLSGKEKQYLLETVRTWLISSQGKFVNEFEE